MAVPAQLSPPEPGFVAGIAVAFAVARWRSARREAKGDGCPSARLADEAGDPRNPIRRTGRICPHAASASLLDGTPSRFAAFLAFWQIPLGATVIPARNPGLDYPR